MHIPRRMPPLLRQGSHYVLFGLLQLLLDWAVFVATTWLGMPASRGNLAGRVSGALLGFWLNGRFTFSDGSGTRLGWRRFLRLALLGTALTVASTWPGWRSRWSNWRCPSSASSSRGTGSTATDPAAAGPAPATTPARCRGGPGP